MIAPDTLLQNRYLVREQIGQGGMGAVYVATDQRFGSVVALKETFFLDVSMRRAFEREARLLNHLRHAALPRVSDHFLEEEGQFLVMEYIAGDDLAEKLKERGGAFPSSEVLNWADQLLDALDYLHTQDPSIIHRDIKPQNLKLTPRNHIVLLDFGLAKGAPALQTKGTATGSVFGYSRNYAPLEQIQGSGTDPRSDLYSLGATLYHLITGVTPPDAVTRATAVINGHDDPLRPANEVHAQVTPSIATVIGEAMAQNASQRPESASAMRDALREAARQVHTAARETRPLAAADTNVYEQETQLIYGASSPLTAGAEAANKTGAVKKEGATVGGAVAAAAFTNVAGGESVVTKVAGAEPTILKNFPRRRTIGIAVSAAVVLLLAAAVYTFTRNPTQTPASVESVQSAPTAPEEGDTSNSNSGEPAEQIIIQQKSPPETSAAPTTTAAAPTNPPVRRTEKPPTTAAPRNETGQRVETQPSVPPNPYPDRPGDPRRTGQRQLPNNDPYLAEQMRVAEERRRAADESRRNAQEQRRLILQRQRPIMGRRGRRTP